MGNILGYFNYRKEYSIVAGSALFDRDYYLRTNLEVARACIDPIKHYLKYGWKQHKDPSGAFSTDLYLAAYPDVRRSGMNPLVHYLKHGRAEGRTVYSDTSQRFGEEKLLERVQQYNAQKNHRKAKVVVYTAIIGGYDKLIIPEYIVDDWDYVVFTDSDISGEHIFNVRKPNYHNADPTRVARYIKTHPHEYFPEYEYSVWIDSNILVRGPHLENSVDVCLQNVTPLMCNPHPTRTCAYQEIDACIKLVKDDPSTMLKQLKRYREDGFPEHFGMLETGVFVCRLNEDRVRSFNDAWWEEIKNGSKRDQLSVMYVLWKHKLPYETLPNMKDIRCKQSSDYYLFLHGNKSVSISASYKQPFFIEQNGTVKNRVDFSRCFSEDDLQPYCNTPVDIVVCVHNALEDVKKCLHSVLDSLLSSHRLILIDDGSEPETMLYLKQIAEKNLKQILLVRNEKAKGYTSSANTGMKLSDAALVILLNSDTIVSRNWALKLLQVAETVPNVGVVGPVSNAATWQSLPCTEDLTNGRWAINMLPAGLTVGDMNRLCERYSLYPHFPKVTLVNGFCYGIRREVIDTIGYFDEKAFPKGYGEEDDYSIRSLNAGFTLAVATHCYVYHAKCKSFGVHERGRLSKSGDGILIKRYGKERIGSLLENMKKNSELNQLRRHISCWYPSSSGQRTSFREEELYQVYTASRSWRYTAPFRKISSLILRR